MRAINRSKVGQQFSKNTVVFKLHAKEEKKMVSKAKINLDILYFGVSQTNK